MKKYKLMAYILSSGLWSALRSVTLEQVLGFRDEELEADLANWCSAYDEQFKSHPYACDWKRFNETGRALAARIKCKLPPGEDIYYEPSDDREFFSPEECAPGRTGQSHASSRYRTFTLSSMKRSLFYSSGSRYGKQVQG